MTPTERERGNVAKIELSNIKIPLEPCVVLKGKFDEEHVSILGGGGCNTNMLSTCFSERIQESVKQKLEKPLAVISHSCAGIQDLTREALEERELSLKGEMRYVLN